jgi:branched-chain amino acid transport system permease protein
MEMATQIIFNGIVASSIYILMALGFNMIFGIMNVVNFAHGEFYMLGAFLVFHAVEKMKISYLMALVIATIVIGIFGMAIEKFIFKRIRAVEAGDFVVSLGIALVLQSVVLIIWGPEDQGIASPFPEVIAVGFMSLPLERIAIILLTVVLLVFFYLFVKHTKVGQSLRAVSQDAEAASLQGIRIEFVYTLSFGIGCSLAAVAGALISPIFSISPTMGGFALLKAFVIVVLGGLGSIPGSILGAVVLGFGDSVFNTLLGATIADILGFVGILILLIARPSGLLGVR